MGLFSLIQDPEVFEEKVLRRNLRPKEEEVTGGCIKLNREEHRIFLFFL
jgi:predicted RNA-binding protein